jgi:hypothetical protein
MISALAPRLHLTVVSSDNGPSRFDCALAPALQERLCTSTSRCESSPVWCATAATAAFGCWIRVEADMDLWPSSVLNPCNFGRSGFFPKTPSKKETRKWLATRLLKLSLCGCGVVPYRTARQWLRLFGRCKMLDLYGGRSPLKGDASRQSCPAACAVLCFRHTTPKPCSALSGTSCVK